MRTNVARDAIRGSAAGFEMLESASSTRRSASFGPERAAKLVSLMVVGATALD